MRGGTQIRVMMLGWEYPPRFAGGLGKACQGLSQAMAKLGAHIFFVLPTFPERVTEDFLEVIGAKESLVEAGWEKERDPEMVSVSSSSVVSSNLTPIQIPAQLFPYGSSPSDAIPRNLQEIIQRMATDEVPVRILGSSKRKVFKVKTETQTVKTQIQQPTEIYGKNLWAEIDKFCARVRLLTEAHEVDLVHAHDWMTFPAAFEFQRVSGVPVFLHVHATEYDRSGENLNHEVFRIEREGFRKANHIFAVSRYTAGIIERLYGVNRKKISVVYNAPEDNVKSFLSVPELKRQPQVVFLGRLTFQKGPDHFLKAAAIVCEMNAEAQFVLCGTGDMLDRLRAQTYKLGIEHRVHFAGFVDPTEVDQVLLGSKVLVMPSVSEPFGLVALEAIRCGIPVILSKQSGVREVLNRALQVDFWDHEKLADQILAALRLKGLSKQLVTEGMVQINQLSWERSAQQVIDIYRGYIQSTFAQAIGGNHGH